MSQLTFVRRWTTRAPERGSRPVRSSRRASPGRRTPAHARDTCRSNGYGSACRRSAVRRTRSERSCRSWCSTRSCTVSRAATLRNSVVTSGSSRSSSSSTSEASGLRKSDTRREARVGRPVRGGAGAAAERSRQARPRSKPGARLAREEAIGRSRTSRSRGRVVPGHRRAWRGFEPRPRGRMSTANCRASAAAPPSQSRTSPDRGNPRGCDCGGRPGGDSESST